MIKIPFQLIFFLVGYPQLLQYLYNKETRVFLSVSPSTFYIFCYFSKIIIVHAKLIIEIGLKNCKEKNTKKIFEK